MTDTAASEKLKFIGSCLCGAVYYEINGNLREVINCHCSLCRKHHGNFGAYTAAEKHDVKIYNNEKQLAWYRSPGNNAQRGFCKNCGSSLFWDLDHSENLSITAGSLEQPTGLHTRTDIYVLDKADYYQLDPNLMKYEHGL